MPVPPPTRAVLRLAAAALVGFWAARGLPAAPEAASEAFFETHVRPLLVEKCVTCHGDKKSEDSPVNGTSATVFRLTDCP